MYGDHLFAFVDRMAELDHAESTVKLYLSCINDVAKAMATAGNAACDLDEKRALELVAAMLADLFGAAQLLISGSKVRVLVRPPH